MSTEALEQLAATAAPDAGNVGIQTIEQADAQAAAGAMDLPRISAKDALGLDEAPSDALKGETEKALRGAPQDKMRDPKTGRFEPTKATAPKAPTKPVVKPAVTKPAAAPASATFKPATSATTVTPTPATPEPPKTVKIGGKEYTVEQLEKLMTQAEQGRQAPPPAPAPAPQAPAQPSPEEIKAAESKYVAELAKQIGEVPLSEESLEKILVGGKEGAAALVDLLRHTAARATLEARKSIYSELNPEMARIGQLLQPLVQNNEQLERYGVEQAFIASYPEYQGEHLATAREVAELLISQYPQAVARMDRGQFIATVDRETDKILSAEFKRWNPSATTTWRDHARAQTAAKAAPAPAPAPVSPVGNTAPNPAPAPAPAPKPVVKPPASNTPGIVTGSGKDWNKSVAGSLID